MVRLADVVDSEREYLTTLECQRIPETTVNPARPLSEARVALVSSAGLIRRGDPCVRAGSTDYGSFDDSVTDADLLISHVSVNFDRSGFAEDVNSVFPRQRLRELAADNIIAAASDEHYSFMGATAPEGMQPHAETLAAHLHEKQINTAVLLPV